MWIPNIWESLSLVLRNKNYESEKICLIFKKGGNIPSKSRNLNENQIIRLNVSKNPVVEVSSFLLQKGWIFIFLPKERSRMRDLFYSGVIESNQKS